LAGTHVHFYRAFNAKTTSRLEWSKVHNPDHYHDKQASQKSRVKNDVRFYGVYRSAVAHTHKLKLPKILLLLPLALCEVLYSFYAMYSLFNKHEPTKEEQIKNAPAADAPSKKGVALVGSAATPSNPYYDERYSKLRKPVTYPQLSCYKMVDVKLVLKCTCYTQQATIYPTSLKLCTDFVDNGFFDHSLTNEFKQTSRSSGASDLQDGGVF
jgi:hypothetical protein